MWASRCDGCVSSRVREWPALGAEAYERRERSRRRLFLSSTDHELLSTRRDETRRSESVMKKGQVLAAGAGARAGWVASERDDLERPSFNRMSVVRMYEVQQRLPMDMDESQSCESLTMRAGQREKRRERLAIVQPDDGVHVEGGQARMAIASCRYCLSVPSMARLLTNIYSHPRGRRRPAALGRDRRAAVCRSRVAAGSRYETALYATN